MTDTSNGLFTVANQESSADIDWTDLPNLLIDGEDDWAFVTYGAAAGLSELASLTAPVSGAEVPGFATITNIEIQWRVLFTEFANDQVVFENVRIATGDAKTFSSTTNISTQTLSGDLAYWNITQQQAKDFAAGTEALEFEQRGIITPLEGNCYWVKVRFSWENPVTDRIPPARMF